MIRTMLSLCALRAAPQDLPYSPGLLATALAAQLGANVIALAGRIELDTALAAAGVYTVVLVALVHTTLMLAGHGARAVQTLVAVNLADALIGLAGTAVDAVLHMPFVQWFTVVWFVAVFGHILRHALGLRLALAVALALVYFFLAAGLTASFVPLPPAIES